MDIAILRVDFATAITIYLFVSIFLIFILWIFFADLIKIPMPDTSKIFVKKCPICLHEYVDTNYRDISKCPQCGSYNKTEPEKTNQE